MILYSNCLWDITSWHASVITERSTPKSSQSLHLTFTFKVTLVGIEMIKSGISPYNYITCCDISECRSRSSKCETGICPWYGKPCIFTLKNVLFYFVALLSYLKSSAAMIAVQYVQVYLLYLQPTV